MPLTEENDLDSLFDDQLGQRDQSRPNIAKASYKDPDQQAEVITLAESRSIDTQTVENNLGEFKRRERVESIDTRGYPKLSQYLSDSKNSSVSIDDIDNLKGLEDISNAIPDREWGEFFTDTGIDLSKGVVGLGEATVGIADLITFNMVGKGLEFIGYDPETSKNILSSQYSASRKKSEQEVSEAEGFIGTSKALLENPDKIFGSVVETIPMMVGTIAAAKKVAATILSNAGVKAGTAEATALLSQPANIARITTASALTEGALAAGSIQEGARQKGVDWKDSAGYAALAGIFTSLITKGASKLIPDIETTLVTGQLSKEGLKAKGKEIAKSMFSEGVLEELPQSAQEQIFSNLSLSKPWDEGVPESMATGLIVGTSMGGSVQTVNQLTNIQTKALNKVTNTVVGSISEQEIIDTATTFAQSSKTRGRKEDRYRNFVSSLEDDKQVHISQDAITEALVNGVELPEYITEQLDDLGTDITIGMDQFGTDIAPNEDIMNALRPHMKLSSESLTPAQMEKADDFNIKDLLERAENSKEKLTEAQTIYEEVKQQLVDTGRQSEATARYSAAILPAYATVKAEDYNISVKEAYEMMGLSIVGPATVNGDGKTLEQAKESGYEGEDITEATEWQQSVDKGLDMSQEARMSRASEQGYDTEKTLYHGTPSEFKAFDKDKAGTTTDTGMFGKGFYFTDDPDYAKSYAKEEGKVLDVHLKLNNPYTINSTSDIPEINTPNETIEDLKNAPENYSRMFTEHLQSLGHDGVISDMGGPKQYIIFEPDQVRSTNAAFDPDFKESAQLLAQSGDLKSSDLMDLTNQELTVKMVELDSGTPLFNEFDVEEFPHVDLVKEESGQSPVLGFHNIIRNGYVMGDGTLYRVNNKSGKVTKVDEVEARNFLKNKIFSAQRKAHPTVEEVKIEEVQEQIQEAATNIEITDREAADINSTEFKNWFDKSVTTNEDDSPLIVYHGTRASVDDSFVFDYSRIGEQGRAEGAGFYFTPSKNVADGYADNGATLEVYLSIQKPIDYNQKGFKKAQLKKIIKAIAKAEAKKDESTVADGFLSNYGDVNYEGLDSVISMAADGMINDTAIDQLSGMVGSGVDVDIVNRATQEVTGYDGFVSQGFSGKGGESDPLIYVAFFPEQIKSVQNLGGFDPKSPDIFHQFVGSKAQTAALDQLQKAQEMSKKNISNDSIRRSTGWFKGVDGRWRYEISDDQASFKGAGITANPAMLKNINNSADVTDNEDGTFLATTEGTFFEDDKLSASGDSREQSLINLANKIAKRHNIGGFDINKVHDGQQVILDNLIDHPELFAAYPDMRNVTINFIEAFDSRGMYDISKDAITLKTGRSAEETLSTLMHEIQHAIQEREDFARGGAAETNFSNSVKDALQQLKQGKAKEVHNWKYYNDWKIDEHQEAADVSRNALMYKSAEKLLNYANSDKPSSVFKHIRNEVQWIYHEEFRKEQGLNDQAREIERMFYDIPKRGVKRNEVIRDLAFKSAQFLKQNIPAEHLKMFKKDERTMNGMLKALERESSKKRAELEPLRELEGEARAAERVEDVNKYKNPFDIYRALAGEVEARTTQARQKLTAEERKARSVLRDMDVQPDEAIIIVGGMEIMAPSSMMSTATQTDGADKRGSIRIDDDSMIIKLHQASDWSSFLHESSHLFLEMEGKFSDLVGEITTDQQAILDFLGAESFKDITTEQHEKFAETFEVYFREGKAPSLALRDAFAAFKRWLERVYEFLTDPRLKRAELNDEIRGVFDRLLATKAEIELATANPAYDQFFKSKEQAGMTDTEWEAQLKRQQQVKDRAKETLDEKVIKEWAKRKSAEWKEEKAPLVEEEMDRLQEDSVYELKEQVKEFPMDRGELLDVMGVEKPMTPAERAIDAKIIKPADSLLVAAARKGGLNISSWESEGFDRKDMTAKSFNNQVFGNPIFRKKDGMTPDDLLELGRETGHIVSDDVNEVLAAVRAEIFGDPVYTSEGYEINGKQEKDLEGDSLKRFIYKNTSAVEGVDPQAYAEIYGYQSVELMISDMRNHPSIQKAANDAAEARMIEKYGDILNDGTIENEAQEAVHNETQAKLLLEELRSLKPERANKINRDYLKAEAKTLIGSMKFKEIQPNKYYRAEIKAAQKAITETDKDQQYIHKIQQLANHYMYREAVETKDRMTKQRKYINHRAKKPYAKGVVVPSYSQNISMLAKSYVMNDSTNIPYVINWMNSQLNDQNQFIDFDIYDRALIKMLDDFNNGLDVDYTLTKFDDMTADELRGLHDQLKHMRFVGGKLTNEKKAELTFDRNQASESIDNHATKEIKFTHDVSKHQGKIDALNEFFYSQRRIGGIFETLDGFEKKGAMAKEYSLINQASNKKLELSDNMIELMDDALKPVLKKINRSRKSTIIKQDGNEFTLNHRARFTLGLNWGNTGNKQAVIEGMINKSGEVYTEQDIIAMLSTMTTEELNSINKVWKSLETLWPELSGVETRLKGVSPSKVQAVPFIVNGVEMTGGHYRLHYRKDPNDTSRSSFEDHFVADGKIKLGTASSANERVGSGGRQVDLDLGHLFTDLEENIHYITHAELASHLNAMFKGVNNPVVNSVIKGYGQPYYDNLIDTLSVITQSPDPVKGMWKFLRYVRMNLTYGFLIGSVRNVIQQPIAITNAFAQLGFAPVVKGAFQFYSDVSNNYDHIRSVSPFMKNRTKLVNREAREQLMKIDSLHPKIGAMKNMMFLPQTFMDSLIAYPVWMAAYDKSGSIEYADDMVAKTIGSGLSKDLGGLFSKGEAESQITFMGTFFNLTWNLHVENAQLLQRGKISGMEYAKRVGWMAVAPALISMFLLSDVPEDDDEAVIHALKEIGYYNLSSIMLLRDLGTSMKGFDPSIPGLSFAKGFGYLGKEGIDLITGDADLDMETTANILRGLQPLMPLPASGQVIRTIKGSQDPNQTTWGKIVEGKDRN